ncbi:hypothetical protein H4219_006007 [Mycoemilia scoparia]|uniref:Chitin-binding type-4 domain-containing protein n=1 Tax=Mycoemilia scoparia TaxID=417184 RepID=A0A9W7ZKD6_9FUNG|nr:hypothetical protein H4219_006007 [Mycoemilia scoparia]
MLQKISHLNISKALVLLSLITVPAITTAHMAMNEPCPRYGNNGPNCPSPPSGQSYDYNIKAPIGTKEGIDQPLCKFSVPYEEPVAVWNAGESVKVSFMPNSAAHGGGHCQFSISYDGGSTFAVIHNVLKHCFCNGPNGGNTASVLSYDIPLPAHLPSGRAIFAWSWVNALGNREFYMNCADVQIKAHPDHSSSTQYTGPEMLVANYGADYPVIEEFNGNYDTGIEFYQQQKNITVGPSASNNSAGAGYSAKQPEAVAPEKQSQNIREAQQSLAQPFLPATQVAYSAPLQQSIPPPADAAAAPYSTPLAVAEVEPQVTHLAPAYSAISASKLSYHALPSSAPRRVYYANRHPKMRKLLSPVKHLRIATSSPRIQNSVSTERVDDGSSSSSSTNTKSTSSEKSPCANHGDMRCSKEGTGYDVCVFGKWVSMPCAAGTECSVGDNDTSPRCNWPKQK